MLYALLKRHNRCLCNGEQNFRKIILVNRDRWVYEYVISYPSCVSARVDLFWGDDVGMWAVEKENSHCALKTQTINIAVDKRVGKRWRFVVSNGGELISIIVSGRALHIHFFVCGNFYARAINPMNANSIIYTLLPTIIKFYSTPTTVLLHWFTLRCLSTRPTFRVRRKIISPKFPPEKHPLIAYLHYLYVVIRFEINQQLKI